MPMKLYKLPYWGGGRGDSSNTRKKTFFSGDVFPYSNGEFAKCDSAKAKAQPMKKLEMEVARSHCLYTV